MGCTKTKIQYKILPTFIDALGYQIGRYVGVYNKKLDEFDREIGFGCFVNYSYSELPHFLDFKTMAMVNAKQVCAALNAMEAAKRQTTRKGTPRKKKSERRSL